MKASSAAAAWLALTWLTALSCEGQIFINVQGNSPPPPPPPPASTAVSTSAGLAAALQNSQIEQIYITGGVTVSGSAWVPGGTAVIAAGRTLAISKDPAMGPGVATLSFGFLPYAIYLQRGSTLIVENLYMKDAPYPSLEYLNNTNNNFYGNYTATGLGPWPALQTEPNTTLRWTNETSTYYSTETFSNCTNFQAKVVFALDQLFNSSVVKDQPGLVTLEGNLTLPLPINYASNGSLAGVSNILSLDNSIQCIPDPATGSSHTGLIVGLAVGIPVGLLILLAAAACLFWRRRRRTRQARPASILPVSMKGNGVPAALVTASSTPHDSGNSGQTSYTGGSGTLKLATERAGVDVDGKPLQQQQSGGDVSSLVAGSAASGGTSLVSGFVPPPQPGSDYQSVARIRMNDTLEGVEIGPLLGKGSGGRVYRGRWNAIPVAVKILDHAVNLQDDISRESLLSTSVAHPLVVSTYRVATVRVVDAPHVGEDRDVRDSRIAQRRVRRINSKRKSAPAVAATGGASRAISAAVDVAMVAGADAAAPAAAAAPAVPVDGGVAPEASPEAPSEPREVSRSDSTSSSGEEQPDEFETWMLLEFCDRGSLHRAIERGRIASRAADGQLELLQVLLCLVDVASGMAYLHSVGVLHGDLKSANVLLKSTATDIRGFVCKIADFGLSRVLADEVSHLSTDTYGTVSYMAPELLGQGKFGKPADVYSFGVLMWELLTGQEPYAGCTVARVLYTVVHEKERPATPEDCPAAYRSIMEACWHEEPLQRPTFDHVLSQLLPLMTDARSKFKAAGGTNVAPFRTRRRSRDISSGH